MKSSSAKAVGIWDVLRWFSLWTTCRKFVTQPRHGGFCDVKLEVVAVIGLPKP